MAHALVGAAEAHATRAEQAYRDAGAQSPELTQASLMAFAAVNCRNETDELALISWRATRLAGVLGALDFPGAISRKGEIGSGDSLIHTMRLVAAALSGMATAAHTWANPHRGPVTNPPASANQAVTRSSPLIFGPGTGAAALGRRGGGKMGPRSSGTRPGKTGGGGSG
jgi:hypothetical protein